MYLISIYIYMYIVKLVFKGHSDQGTPCDHGPWDTAQKCPISILAKSERAEKWS